MTIEPLTSGNATPAGPTLHPFDPKSNWNLWVPAAYLSEDWPVYEAAPVGNHLFTATVSHLYRFFDAEQALLYVGVTTNPKCRWTVHRNCASWWRTARFVSLEPVPPAERLLRELLAIEQGRPKHNRTMPLARHASQF